jgi:hypothetical protein
MRDDRSAGFERLQAKPAGNGTQQFNYAVAVAMVASLPTSGAAGFDLSVAKLAAQLDGFRHRIEPGSSRPSH